MLEEVPAAYEKEERFLITALQRELDSAIRYAKDYDPFDNLLNAAITESVARRGISWFRRLPRE
jgi:hypothetical protein